MELSFASHLAGPYSGPTQKARVLTEGWVGREVYCCNCGYSAITRHGNNRPGADLYCSACREEFELKSSAKPFGRTVVDGAYRSMVEQVQAGTCSNFMLLRYDRAAGVVIDLSVIPKHFITLKAIQQRTPLAVTARRAGWVGCKILLDQIPEAGRIFLVRNQVVLPRQSVHAQWERLLFLRDTPDTEAKGWLLDVIHCIERLGLQTFTLQQLYGYEADLQARYPGNRNLRAKIRQQLQILRDRNYIAFLGGGTYRLADDRPGGG